jgi:hypothetical protein
MAATFPVDDVPRATEPLPTRRFSDVIGDVLALGGDGEQQVVNHGPTHPLLGAVHLAFSEHRPLVLQPDAIWLTIAQGVAQHVRLYAEELRPRLVRHHGTKTLEVVWNGTMPSDRASWSIIAARFRDAVADQIGDGRARLFECDFSTSTDVERVASRIVLMDAYAPYFDYVLACVCGIPEVTLQGTVDDWKKIRDRIDIIAELDLGVWARSLAPICDQFVRAAAGDPDVAFWKRIYKPRDAYGEKRITGWIARLYPYLVSAGQIAAPNPLLNLAIDEPRDDGTELKRFGGPGIWSSLVPSLPSTARITVIGPTDRSEVALDGGVLAVAQDEAGRLAPVCGWVLRRSKALIAEVVERIQAAYPFTPAEAGRRSHDTEVIGPADLIGLYCEIEEATLFAPERAWRIRPPAEHQGIVFKGVGRPDTVVWRVIDLPDQTFIGLADLDGSVFVRARADSLELLPKGTSTYYKWRSRQPDGDVPVLRGRLAEILSAALDASGDDDPAEVGTLADAVRPRPSSPSVVPFGRP